MHNGHKQDNPAGNEREFSMKYGPWAVLAGAAEGLGEAFSIALARRGMNIVMVDHQEDRLRQLASRIESEFAVQARPLHLDLALPGATDAIMDAARPLNCRFLLYNAELFIDAYKQVTSVPVIGDIRYCCSVLTSFIIRIDASTHSKGNDR